MAPASLVLKKSSSSRPYGIATAMGRSVSYFKSLRDPSTGGFSFAEGQPATLMATAQAILGLEAAQALNTLSADRRAQTVSFILAHAQADGSFRDARFEEKDFLSRPQGVRYFLDETSAFCLQALDALKSAQAAPRASFSDRFGSNSALDYLKSLEWKRPWTDANRTLFALGSLGFNAIVHSEHRAIHEMDTALDWLESQINPQTGLWPETHASRIQAMAATCHFAFFFRFRARPLPHAKKLIDSCLSLEQPHGLFCEDHIGHSCFDYDALHLLRSASETTDYRREEIEALAKRSIKNLLALANSDGGFAHQKIRIRFLMGRSLPRLFSNQTLSGRYENGWRYLSCPAGASNSFSTWFRLMALASAAGEGHSFGIRRLPFLGWRSS